MAFEDSPFVHNPIEKLSNKYKQRHSCSKTLCLIFALISYILAFLSIIRDLFFGHQIFDCVLNRFHSQSTPLILPNQWIAPFWITVYSLQAPWLFYAITTLCRRNGSSNDSDYLYKYPRPVSQMQLLTFSLSCWSHLIFLYLIQNEAYILAVIYIILGTVALTFSFVTSIIHLQNYERELSTSHLYADIWSIRIFVHNGLGTMLAWQIALFGYSSLYACNILLSSSTSKTLIEIHESVLNMIALCLIGSICIIGIFYIILIFCCFFKIMCHITAGWILFLLLSISHWYQQDSKENSLLMKSFYVSTGLCAFILCIHLIFILCYYCCRTCRPCMNSNMHNYRHDILQGKH